MALDEPNDAVVDDVDHACIVEHFEHILVLGSWLEPEQGKRPSLITHDQFHHCPFRPFGRKEEHHHFGDGSCLNPLANRASGNTSSSISGMR